MNRLITKTLVLWIMLIILACQSENESNQTSIDKNSPLFSLLSPDESGINFSNIIKENVNRNATKYDYYYNGSGVAIGDINNDGLDDLYFTASNSTNQLYLNKGNLQFEDISTAAGVGSDLWSTGVTMIDINNDGLLDIYVCNSAFGNKKFRTNQLYINNGDLTFTEKATEYGIANSGYSSQASFFDYDKDGDLDLFVMNHSTFQPMDRWLNRINNMPSEELRDHSPTFYENNGNNTFKDISQESGILKPAFGLGLITSDINHDGWIDIYVANDYFLPDFMFLNQGDGTFIDEIKNKTSHISFYSMGTDAADFNNDGLLDISVVDMTPDDHVRNKVLMASMDVSFFQRLKNEFSFQSQYMFNSLQLNNGKGIFSEIGLSAGVSKTDWSWATLFADFDNDGLKDNLVTNGFRRDTKHNDWRNELDNIIRTSGNSNLDQRKFNHLQTAEANPVTNFLFKNMGNYQFEDMSYDWGFREPSFSNGAAYADLDLDGDLDLVINNIDKEAFIFRNNGTAINGHNYIRFKVLNNTEKQTAYNSKISIYHGNEIQYAELHPVRGYLSSVESYIHFGLKNRAKIDSVKVEWLNGSQTVIPNLEANKTHTISFKAAYKEPLLAKKYTPQFSSMPSSFLDATFIHHENDFDDFAKEILLPHRQSMLGPFISVGDINGDQREDFFIGGAKGQSGQFYLQNEKGNFTSYIDQALASDKEHEDMGSLFFDFDRDGDLDLYVTSGGGGEFKEGDVNLQDRLYINNGSGGFKKSSGILPIMPTSTSQVKETDIDNDGDFDLFITGRTTPNKYPYPTDSYLLRNDNGRFIDITEDFAPEFRNLGMVTDAVWSDVDQDGLPDLFIVGEWLPVMYYKNTGERLENHSDQLNLDNKTGWWKRIIATDFDNDGDEDFIIGNIGNNNKFQPSEEKPLHVFCNDFDENGTLDIVLSKSYENNLVPIRGKECSSQQMPFVSEKFTTFKDFAESSLNEIYGEQKLEESIHYTANCFQSVVLENKQGEGFEFHELPMEAQFAPINAIISKDFDNDGNLDLIIAGNEFQTEVETPKYDAGKGLFLKGNGDGTYQTSIGIEESGIILPLDTKDLKLITIKKDNSQLILVANNNNSIQAVRVNK